MLPLRPTLEHPPLASSSASGGSCLGLDPCAGIYIHTIKLVQGIPVVTSILRPLARPSSSSSLASTPDQDSFDDYLEIGTGAYEEPAEGGHLILMVAPNGDQLCNSSSRDHTIGRTDASNAQTPSAGLVQNLNLDFNALRVQAIMETIQRMAPDGSPLAVLAQQGAEAANLVVAEKLASVPQRKPYVSNNDRARHD
jgi:hypothetical protein